MKLSIMQPYFCPYLGYLALIKYSDLFIVFDTPQFIRHGWIERNRILKPTQSWQYIKVPLKKHSQKTAIKDIKINNSTNWQEKIVAQLTHYKKDAKYFDQVVKLIENSLNLNTDSIVQLNIHILKNICKYLDVKFKYEIFSEMNLDIEKVKEPDEWALNISKAINADEYINLPGGESFFNKEKYQKENINIKFLKVELREYNQYRKNFEPGLSIIDVMMFNSPEEINKLIDNYLSIN